MEVLPAVVAAGIPVHVAEACRLLVALGHPRAILQCADHAPDHPTDEEHTHHTHSYGLYGLQLFAKKGIILHGI